MQSICHLSRRWHQQFCRSPSFASHRNCVRQWQFIRTIRVRPSPNKATETAKPTYVGDFTVREYEQYGSDTSTRVPVDPDEVGSRQEEEDVRQELKRLQTEIDELKKGFLGPKSELTQSIPEGERSELLKTLEDKGVGPSQLEELLGGNEIDLDKDLDQDGINPFDPEVISAESTLESQRAALLAALEAEDDGSSSVEDLLGEGKMLEEALAEAQEEGGEDGGDQPEAAEETPLSVTLRVPARHKAYVRTFNDSLLRAQNDKEEFKHHLHLWKDYIRCQQHIPDFSRFVDEDVWDFLWKSQTVHFPRPQQIVMLAQDMFQADVAFDLAQTIDYINAAHATGDTTTAIQLWEQARPQVGTKDQQAPRFWQSGINIYAAVGRPKKAQSIANAAFQRKLIDADGWIPIIEAWAKSKKPSAANSLWACYLQLKQQYAEKSAQEGSKSRRLPLSVLGQISSALLNAGRRDMALSVFKDMLASDQHASFDSTQVYAQLLDGVQDVEKTNVNETIISRIGLEALMSFPGRFKNKFFFGAWIKWLIGDGKVGDAALVVELMQEYGIRPDARHLNGIVGAWIREGSREARERAEQMAWAMIHARIEHVRARTKTLPSDTDLVNAENPYSSADRLPRFLQRNVPPATIETFSILLQRFTRQSDAAKAEHLTDILVGPAALKPNSFILNHWMYMSLRSSDLSALWQRYERVKSQIEPDLETFAVLWQGCKRNVDRASPALTSSYPTPRQLAREMHTWFTHLSPSKRTESKEGFTQALHEQIVRCFCLHSDLYGLFVILRLLKETVSFYPDDDATRLILMAVARMLPQSYPLASKPRRAAIRRRDAAYRGGLSNLGAIMQALIDREDARAMQHVAAAQQGVLMQPGSRVDGGVSDGRDASGQIRLRAIEIFLCLVLKRRLHVDGDLVNDLVVAGRAIGWDLDLRDVEGVVEQALALEVGGKLGEETQVD